MNANLSRQIAKAFITSLLLSANTLTFATDPVEQKINPNRLANCPSVGLDKKKDQEKTANWNNCWGKIVYQTDSKRRGDTAEGEWQNGLLNGQGIYTFLNGDKYEGEFKNGMRHGEGFQGDAAGGFYSGGWKHDKRTGFANVVYKNGDYYFGEYQNDSRHGEGTYTKLNGTETKGNWKNGKAIRLKNNNESQATTDDLTKQIQASGIETESNPNNLSLCPQPDRSKKAGPEQTSSWSNCWGKYKYDSSNYSVLSEGEWKFGKLDGYGYLSDSNQTVAVGTFLAGAISSGSVKYKSGNKYSGNFKTFSNIALPHGFGVYRDKAETYIGQHDEGKREGRGKLIKNSGETFDGFFKNDEFLRALTSAEKENELLEAKKLMNGIAKNEPPTPNISKRLNLTIQTTEVEMDGSFVMSIRTNTDTASLKINGDEHGGNKEGSYLVRKVARAGQETRFTIVATDVNGNSDTKTITVNRPIAESQTKFSALNPSQVKKQPTRDAVAVIIGIADYKNLPRADFANDDASVFYDYAIRALGIKPENIKLLVDGNADDVAIYQTFKSWLPSHVRPTTDVYVFYSGHGLPGVDGQGLYLLPQRAHRDLIEKTAISQNEINGFIQAAKPRSVTIFLDSCYSGVARTGETLLASARPVVLKSDKKLFPEEFTVITASQADQISSSSPDLKHGIFSYYLMRGMEGEADANRDGKITAGEMHSYLTEQVMRQAGMMNRKQQPQLVGDSSKVLVGTEY